jgi:uncharacterized protein (DUF488 family)
VSESEIKVLTIGHSTLPLGTFLAMLEKAGVTAVADVRSSPFSRRVPHYSRNEFRAMALEPTFIKGIDRVISGAREHTIALMCSEHNPLDCHRCLLVGRALTERHVSVSHILNNGKVADHHEIEEKLLSLFGGTTDDMFATREERLRKAYRLRSKNAAYREPQREMADSMAQNWDSHAG